MTLQVPAALVAPYRDPSPPTEKDIAAPTWTWKTLMQKHPEYKANEGRWSELEDFYAAGYQVVENAAKYLPKLTGESQIRYKDRLHAAGHIGYLPMVIDYFAGALFECTLEVNPPTDADNAATPGDAPKVDAYYTDFSKDADLEGTPANNLIEQVTAKALLKRWAFIAVDAPTKTIGVEPQSLAEEEAQNQNRVYAYLVEPEVVIDWKERGRSGDLDWAILHRCSVERDSPESIRNEQVHEFTIWRMVDSVAVWERYEIRCLVDQPPKENDPATLLGSGKTSFKRIPLVRLKLPMGLWLGNKIGTLVKEHWQRRTNLVAALNRSCVAIPVVKLGPQANAPGGSVPADVVDDEHRGDDPVGQFQRKGFMVLGADDEIEFPEPAGTSYQIASEDLKDLKDEIFRTVHQTAASASNSPSAIGRSGLSKMADRESEAIILSAIGLKVRTFGERLYTTISEARNENVKWVAHGLDSYDTDDRVQTLAEALQVDAVKIPSKTFKIEYKNDLANKLKPGMSSTTQQAIRKEIEDGVENEQELGDLLHEQNKAVAEMDPVPPVAKVPGGKPGAKGPAGGRQGKQAPGKGKAP